MNIHTFKVETHTVKADPVRKVILYEYSGAFLPGHAREIIHISDKVLAGSTDWYAVCDVGQLKMVPAETRKILIDWFSHQRFPAIVCFGASLTVRTLATLITSGARLLSGSIPRPVFVHSEAEAFNWIAGQHPSATAV